MAKNTATFEKACGELCARMGLRLHDVALEKEPTGMYLRVYIDKEGGVQLDDCEAFHRAIMPSAENTEYDFLEVCSPGIDRPIKTERDAAQCVGMRVNVRLFKPLEGQKSFLGDLAAMNADEVAISVAGQIRTFPRKSVALVKLEPDLDGELEQATTMEGGL